MISGARRDGTVLGFPWKPLTTLDQSPHLDWLYTVLAELNIANAFVADGPLLLISRSVGVSASPFGATSTSIPNLTDCNRHEHGNSRRPLILATTLNWNWRLLPDHGAHKKSNEARIAVTVGIEYVGFLNGHDKLQEVDMRHTVEP